MSDLLMYQRCSHNSDTVITADELAMLSEGVCPSCQEATGSRDGYATCPCCGVGWRLRLGVIEVRYPLTAIEEEDSDG